MKLSYFNKKNFFGMASFKDEAILLDLRKDRYYIFDKTQSQKLSVILESKWIKKNSFFYPQDVKFLKNFSVEDLNDFIKLLIKKKILSDKLFQEPCLDLFRGRRSLGVENIDWHLPLQDSKIKVDKKVFYCLIILAWVHFVTKLFGFKGLAKILRKKKFTKGVVIKPEFQQIIQLCHTLNQACHLYPIRTKCLEWGATLTMMGLKRGWDIVLKIGVQNYPFLSHAWTEVDGNVIFDDASLPDNLSTILSLPLVGGRKVCS